MLNRLIWQFKKAPITVSLIGICIIVYILSFFLFGEEMTAYEGLFFGGYNPVYVMVTHEYYRLFTANFIHFGFLHLAVNCYSLYGLGCLLKNHWILKNILF